MTRCWQVAALPLLSVAVQVTKLVLLPYSALALSVMVTVPQLSLAVGLPRATPVAKQAPEVTLAVTSAREAIVGSLLSRSLTRCWQVAAWPPLSVRVHGPRSGTRGICGAALPDVVL